LTLTKACHYCDLFYILSNIKDDKTRQSLYAALPHKKLIKLKILLTAHLFTRGRESTAKNENSHFSTGALLPILKSLD
jgi:hypothetical protein